MDDIRDKFTGDPSWALVDAQHRLIGVIGTIGNAFASGLMGALSQIISLTGLSIPSTVTLHSSDASRKIELYPDAGGEAFQPAYDVMSSTMLVCVLKAPADRLKLTALATDTYTVK